MANNGGVVELLASGPAKVGRTPFIDLRGYDRLVLVLEGSYAGKVGFRGAVREDLDAATWFAVGLRPVAGGVDATAFYDKAAGDPPVAFTLPLDLSGLSGFCLELDSAVGALEAYGRKEGT